jgi:hypothetical protein
MTSNHIQKEHPMASVSQLGYVGIGTSGDKSWRDLVTNILGIQVVPGDDPSTIYLRMDWQVS